MTDAPERISMNAEQPWTNELGGVEYLRADTAIPVAKVQALVERWVAQSNLGHLDPSYHLALADCAAELRQLMGEE